LKLLPGGKGKGGDRREGEGKGIKGKGGEEEFRAFPQFQICHYTIDWENL